MNNNYTITLADGTIISNLTKNGTNYVSNTKITADTFLGNCSPLMIRGDESVEFHSNAELVNIMEINGQYYIAFRDIPQNELREAKMRSDLDYLAMMSDVDFEEV